VFFLGGGGGGGRQLGLRYRIKESENKGMYLDDIAYVNVDCIIFTGSFEHGH